MLSSLVEKMFHVSSAPPNPPGPQHLMNGKFKTPAEIYASIKPISISKSFILAKACSFSLCLRKDRRNIVLEEGVKRLDDELDVVRLIRRSRMLSTLLRLLLAPDERRLLSFQRKEAVINLSNNKNSNSNHSDSTILKLFK